MKNNISQRLGNILMQDKSLRPERIMPVLKSDIRDVLRNYGELKSDITLEIEDADDGYNVIIFTKITRFFM